MSEQSPTTHTPEPSTSTSFLDQDSNIHNQPTLDSLANASTTNNNNNNKDNEDLLPESSSSPSNPLNEFAQQVLGLESDAHNLLDLGKSSLSLGYSILSGEEETFNDLLQNEERREKQAQNRLLNNGQNDDQDENENSYSENDHNHNNLHGVHEIDPELVENELSRQIQESNNSNNNEGEHVVLDENGNRINLDIPLNPEEKDNNTLPDTTTRNNNLNLVYGGRIGKRKRINHSNNNLTGNGTNNSEEIITDADGNPVEPHVYTRLKKDSHKEVERRRREAINEGINEIAALIPGGMDKQGKGMTLKRAATYLIELSAKIRINEEEISKRDIEKQDLDAQLAHLQIQLQEERDRSMRFETSWREAEDRSASSNFELESLRAELEELKAAQNQNQNES